LKPKVILGLKGAFFLFLNIPPLFAKAGTALSIGVIKVSINFMFIVLIHPLIRLLIVESSQKNAFPMKWGGF